MKTPEELAKNDNALFLESVRGFAKKLRGYDLGLSEEWITQLVVDAGVCFNHGEASKARAIRLGQVEAWREAARKLSGIECAVHGQEFRNPRVSRCCADALAIRSAGSEIDAKADAIEKEAK